jgi:hypothetical protein
MTLNSRVLCTIASRKQFASAIVAIASVPTRRLRVILQFLARDLDDETYATRCVLKCDLFAHAHYLSRVLSEIDESKKFIYEFSLTN